MNDTKKMDRRATALWKLFFQALPLGFQYHLPTVHATAHISIFLHFYLCIDNEMVACSLY